MRFGRPLPVSATERMEALQRYKEGNALIRQLHDQPWHDITVEPDKDLHVELGSPCTLQLYARKRAPWGSLSVGVANIKESLKETNKAQASSIYAKINQYFFSEASTIQRTYARAHDEFRARTTRTPWYRSSNPLSQLEDALQDHDIEGFSHDTQQLADDLTTIHRHKAADIPSGLTWFYDHDKWEERKSKLQHNKELARTTKYVARQVYDSVWQKGFEIRQALHKQ